MQDGVTPIIDWKATRRWFRTPPWPPEHGKAVLEEEDRQKDLLTIQKPPSRGKESFPEVAAMLCYTGKHDQQHRGPRTRGNMIDPGKLLAIEIRQPFKVPLTLKQWPLR